MHFCFSCPEIILRGSYTSLYILQAEAGTAYVLNYLFKNTCIVSGLGRQVVTVSEAKGQIGLLSCIRKIMSCSVLKSSLRNDYYKKLRFLKLGILFCNPALAGVRWPPLCYSMGSEAWGTGSRKYNTLVITTAESNKLSLVSDPGVSCLLPAPWKWWQANLLACK